MTDKISRGFRKKKDSKSFFSTLLLSFLLTAVASTIILGVFLTAAYANTGIKNTQNYNQKLLSQTNHAIDQMNENVDQLGYTLLTNHAVQAFLSLQNEKDASTIPVQAGTELHKLSMVLPYVEGIYLYNSCMNLLYSSGNGYQQTLEDAGNTDIIQHLSDETFLNSYDKTPILSIGESGKKEAVFSYYILDHYSEYNGRKNAIVINVHASTLTDSIRAMKKRSSDMDSSFILLDKNLNYMTGVLDESLSAKDWLEPVQDTLSDEKKAAASFITLNGKRYFQTYTTENENGWYLLNFMPASQFFKTLISTVLIGCLLMIVVLGFAFAGCLYFSKKLNSPVQSITDMLTKKKFVPSDGTEPKEFQMIVSGLSALSENNKALRTMQKKTRYSLTQACLNDLVTEIKTDSPELLPQKLEHLGLGYLKEKKLHMAVLKVDRYHEIIDANEPDELWALRFSVVNIVEEIVSAVCKCNAFSRENDKFVLLMDCETMKEGLDIEETLTETFHSIQENIEKFLHFTVSITYSTGFQGLNHLPSVYKNLKSALNLKMHYGHNCLIPPYKADEEIAESFHLSSKALYPFIDKLSDGQAEEAKELYAKFTQNLYLCDYDDVISTVVHLVYSVYERLTEKYPMLKDTLTAQLKTALSELEKVETGEDVDSLVKNFSQNICDSVLKLKEDPANQNTSITAQKIAQIIESNYTDPSLCLCSIADEIGLSQNYTGHLFKQVMQKSVAQYILDVRMEKLAYYLQNTDWHINKILDSIGMEKNNYFYTRFKKYFGMSLGEYRAQYQTDSTAD